MAENILEKIIKKKSEKITSLKKNISLDSLNKLIDKNQIFLNFKEKIENNIKNDKISIIAEIKKASPSAGVIIKDYDPVKIAIFSLFFLIIFIRIFSAILNFF